MSTIEILMHLAVAVTSMLDIVFSVFYLINPRNK